MTKVYVQYGCGHSAPQQWINFDASPTLTIQKLPVIGYLLKKRLNTVFPPNVKYGDIVKGLPVADNSCDGVYCSHTLEHLSLQDCRIALKNSYKILKEGGLFRCVLPDLEWAARKYVNALDSGNSTASLDFMGIDTLLGMPGRPRGLKAFFTSFLGNSHHLWMWDKQSLTQELLNAGFKSARVCKFNDSKDEYFSYVENESRFENAVAIECIK